MSVRVLSKGETTRERLLDLAEKAILQKGFAATTIDELIAQADITKSSFFYHFRDNNDLMAYRTCVKLAFEKANA